MATRMQQRRGTAEQWTDADPILAAGEIGFETDTNQFKIGDGVNAWSDLSYFKNLEDLGGSLDDYVLVSTKGQPNGVAELDSTGNIPVTQLGNIIDGADAALDTLNEIATLIGDGSSLAGTLIANISQIDTVVNGLGTDIVAVEADINTIQTNILDIEGNITTLSSRVTTNSQDISTNATAISELESDLATHASDTTNIHGILDTAALATQSYVDDQVSTAQTNAEANADATADTKIATHNSDTTSVHGIANTAELATASDVSTAVSDHSLLTLNVHGISNTAELETQTGAQAKADAAVVTAGTAADTKVADAVAALTKSSVGLANVDNTADADKPVSTATQTALDLKADLNGATFSGDVTVETNLTVDGNLTVTGTTTTVSAQDLVVSDPLIYIGEGNTANLVDLGIVSSFNDGAYQHAGIVRDSSAGKWKIFKGVTDEPTTTINFAQGSLDDLAVGALEATTVTPSSGIVFSDGTQVKVGVPSITEFATAISSSATLSAGEQDKFVPLTGAVTITLPATGYSTGQSIDFYQASGTGAQFASTNSVVGTPGLKFRTTNSVVTAMKTSSGWLVFGDLSA